MSMKQSKHAISYNPAEIEGKLAGKDGSRMGFITSDIDPPNQNTMP